MRTLTNRRVISRQAGFKRLFFCSRRRALAVALTVLPAVLLLPSRLAAQVPAVVSSSPLNLTPTGGVQRGTAVTDRCGNVYINQSNAGILQIQAGTGKLTVISPNTNGYNNGTGLAIDPSKTTLYFPTSSQWYSSQFSQVNVGSCTPGGTTVFGNNAGSFNGYYYGTASSIAVDGYGDVFFVTSAAGKNILEEKCTTAPATACTGAPTATSATVILAAWANNITSVAADSTGNVYFTDGSANVYQLKAPYTGTPVTFGASFAKPVGLTFDSVGNLYIADATQSILYEIPNEASGLNPADQFQVLQNVSLAYPVAIDASQNIAIPNSSGNLIKYIIGGAALPSTPIATASAATAVNFVFNASTTPATIKTFSGTAASTQFAAATTGCIAGTTYAAGKSCSVAVTFTPGGIGTQSGSLILANASGAPLSLTAITGIGLGAAATIDPGTVNPYTASLTSPTGDAIDSAGNLFVTDAKKNSIVEFAAGSTAGVAVSTGPLSLNSPNGVAVDGFGNIFVADTGNNRIVEVPASGGALQNASSAALTVSVKGPNGLAVDGLGNLYIADTGNNRLLVVPDHNGVLNPALAQTYGAGFNAPLAVAVDSAGDVFVADTGNNAVQELPGPIGSAAQVKAASGLVSPSGLATDAANNLFVVDKGASAVYRYPNYSGTLGSKTIVGGSIAAPYGIAIDASGNLYVTDSTNAVVDQVARVQAALNFGGWNINSTSTPLTATVSNGGNLALTFPTPSYAASGATTAGFTVTNDGCAAAASVASGASCNITATFSPTKIALNNLETLTLSSNASNGTAKINLIGTGANITPSTLALVLTSPAAGVTINAGASVSFTATVGTGSNSAIPGGSVVFFVNGTQVGSVKVASGAASITLSGGLPGGTVAISANYSGDSLNYSGSSTSLTETVVALPDTLSLAISTPYTNPASVNDNSANAGGPSVPLVATLVPSTSIIPAGTVSFYSGSGANPTLLGLASVLPAGNGVYQATLRESSLRAGKANVVENNSTLSTYSIFAVYSGDTNYGPSTSNAASLNVVAPPVTPPACATQSGPTCQLNTTGATFTITPANPSITIASTKLQGQGSGTVTLAINSYGGWAGVLNFTCSNLPAYASCVPYPGAPVVNPSASTNPIPPTPVLFTINTNIPPIVPTASGLLWWTSGTLGLGLLIARRRTPAIGLKGIGLFAGVLLLIASVGGLGACSNSISSSHVVTPAGTTNVLVTVSAAQSVPNTTNGSVQLPDTNTGSFTVNLTVQ